MAKVIWNGDEDECWEYEGCTNRAGYGRITIGSGPVLTHRFSYELFVGPIPDGIHVLHHRDNPPCVNPSHLWLGTHADNMADMAAKGRCPGNGRRKVDA